MVTPFACCSSSAATLSCLTATVAKDAVVEALRVGIWEKRRSLVSLVLLLGKAAVPRFVFGGHRRVQQRRRCAGEDIAYMYQSRGLPASSGGRAPVRPNRCGERCGRRKQKECCRGLVRRRYACTKV